MEIYTKGTLQMGKKMVREFLYFQIPHIMRVILKIIKYMERVYIDGRMDWYMKDNSNMDKYKDWEY